MATEPTLLYIKTHRTEDIRQLALGKHPDGVDMAHALEQIAGWQTARHKLPAWAAAEGIVYPPRLSMEQCSSEPTALYKQRLAERLLRMKDAGGATAADNPTGGDHYGKTADRSLVDLTGGFGVDFSYMAKAFDRRTYVERQERLCEAARNNMPLLRLADARIVCCDAAEFLEGMPPADIVFIDPARRDDRGSRTYAIADCTPDILSLRETLMRKARTVIVKLSPMLDWHKAAADFGSVSEVHIVSAGGECKELLLVAQMGQEQPAAPDVFCSECGDNAGRGAYTFHVAADEMAADCAPAGTADLRPAAGLYLHEPGPSIMKAGCFGALRRRYGARQLAPNSHLFLSEEPIGDFPGRSFVIRAVSSMNKKELRQLLQGITKANIAVRNFPLAAAELRKRLKIADGGEHYLFGTTLADGSHSLLLCQKSGR